MSDPPETESEDVMKTQNTQVTDADIAGFIAQGAITAPGPYGTEMFVWISGDGVPDRRAGPAVIHIENDRIIEEEWFRKGKQYRKGGPAFVRYHPNGHLAEQKWFQRGVEHRDVGPAIERYHPNGQLMCEIWMQSGVEHRIGEPAERHFDKNGNVWLEHWLQRGRPRRPKGPEMVEYRPCGRVLEESFVLDLNQFIARHLVYRPNGTVEKHKWTMDDQLHRDGQPAVIYCDQKGLVTGADWFEHGEPVTAAHPKIGWLKSFKGQPVP